MLHEIYDDFFMHDGRFLSETKLSKALLLISSAFEKRKKNRKLRFFLGKKGCFYFFFLFVILKLYIDIKNDYKYRQMIFHFEVNICRFFFSKTLLKQSSIFFSNFGINYYIKS